MGGKINITSATELKELLLQALASGRVLRVNLEGATELDVTARQLLWSAEGDAGGSIVGCTLAGRVPEEISVAVGDAGFEKFPVPVNPK